MKYADRSDVVNDFKVCKTNKPKKKRKKSSINSRHVKVRRVARRPAFFSLMNSTSKSSGNYQNKRLCKKGGALLLCKWRGGASHGMAQCDSGGRGFSNRRSIPSAVRTDGESPERSTTFPGVFAWPDGSCWTRPCSGQEIQTPWEEKEKKYKPAFISVPFLYTSIYGLYSLCHRNIFRRTREQKRQKHCVNLYFR